MTFKIVLLSTILYFFHFLFCAQEISSDWEIILRSDLVQHQKEKKLDSIINRYQEHSNDSLLERITHKYAIWKYKIGKLNDALKTNQYSFELKKKMYPEDSALLQHGLKNQAFFYFKNNEYAKSIKSYEELLRINSKNVYAADAYSALGKCYLKIGDYYKASLHFDLVRSLLLEKKAYNKLIANNINAAGNDIKLETLSSYNKGIKNLLFADSLAQKINAKASTRYNIKILLGTLHNQEKNLKFKKALDYYNEALGIAKQLKDTGRIAHTLEIIGNLYNTIDPDLAIDYHTKAIDYNHKKDTLQLAISLSNIGFCLEQKELYDKCIKNYDQAIELLLSNKSISELSASSPNTSYLLIILKDLANAFLKQFKSTTNRKSLQQSIKTFLIADRLIDLIRIESKEFRSKLYWRKQSADLYGKAIEACFLAKDTESAFFFMEKNKALLLSEDINNSKIRQSLEIPTKLVEREIQLKKNIYFLENSDRTANTSEDSITIELLNKKRVLKKLQDSIQNSFPKYNPLPIQSTAVSLKEIQKDLDPNTIILEYNISEHEEYGLVSKNTGYTSIHEGSDYGVKLVTKAYVLYISRQDTQFLEIEEASGLKQQVALLVGLASTPFKTKATIYSYNKIANEVYNKLFPTHELKENTKSKKIKIIPDNYLNYLPFEALITSTNNTPKNHYLIEDCEISYAYSNSFLQQTKEFKNKKNNSFLGFAPLNFEKYNMAPLENSIPELSRIKNYFQGKIYTDEAATKEEFLTTLPNYNIIHLATHANALDSISPWIAFSNKKLNLEELYFTKNNADLVVLSGCNTLQGKQETGEGVMSLARGFFHSGAKSVVSSLWSIDDRSTAYIMDQFYKNLRQNQSKSEALRNAKLHYLNNHQLSERSPHFWATFVLLGDASVIHNPSSFSVYWLLSITLILSVLILAYQKFKR
ncbi:CHAT domain-containing protein [Aquimarina celericrescens]|uniref:CHAT domain-containing protein n=1 Tax=Aquimarina celericrescens TaxID=1964542 RepID=A0ABW5B473_9FLAO|nr:CHAT domain-containing protein [Aquimarina celericrescens]